MLDLNFFQIDAISNYGISIIKKMVYWYKYNCYIYIYTYIIGILDNLGIGLLYIGDIVYTIIGIIYILYIGYWYYLIPRFLVLEIPSYSRRFVFFRRAAKVSIALAGNGGSLQQLLTTVTPCLGLIPTMFWWIP